MDSDDDNDWADAVTGALSFADMGWKLFLVLLAVALILFIIVASIRTDESNECTEACGDLQPVVFTNNQREVTCMCEWADGSLHKPLAGTGVQR